MQEDAFVFHIEKALRSGEIFHLMMTVYGNETPPCGLLGFMDWRFHGKISQYLQKGILRGEPGECTYLPLQKNHQTFHLILIGAGMTPRPGYRPALQPEVFKPLRKNLLALKFEKVGLSRNDLGQLSDAFLDEHLSGVTRWMLP